MQFELGPHCADRTRLYHKLHHWKFQLMHEVSKLLERKRSALGVDERKLERDDDVEFSHIVQSLVNAVLDDEQWLKERYAAYRRLIDEAQSARNLVDRSAD